MALERPKIRCREIAAEDRDGLIKVLQRGFPHRSREHWLHVFQRLTEHTTPPGLPKYGYLVEAEGVPVGILLVIFSSTEVNGEIRIRANVASWYVDPEFRSYATLLAARALGHKNVTYVNITPARHTWPILKAQGYLQLCAGRFVAIAMLAPISLFARVRSGAHASSVGSGLNESEARLLRAHAGFGCIALTCGRKDDQHPFVFVRRLKYGWIPYALLVYCRDLEDFTRFAGPLGRHLALRGMTLVFVDTNHRLPGLLGRFTEAGPQFYKGPHRPNAGDLAYTERVMFGV